MDAARIDLEEIPFFDGDLADELAPALLLDHADHLIVILGVVAHHDGGVRIAVQNVPALHLTQGAIFVRPRVDVVGMDLDAQIALGVDDLDQQRKHTLRALCAKQLRVVLPQGA